MRRYVDLFKQTFSEFASDKVPRLGAALAYYTIFSIAPLLLIAIAIAGLVFGREAAGGQIYAQLRGVLGPESAEMIQKMVEAAAKPKAGSIATIVGVVTLLLGASGVIGQLKDALNTIWDVKPPATGFMGRLKNYLMNGAMVRLRTVLMTALLAMLGLMPMATDKRYPGLSNVSIHVAGVWVHPGEWLVADEDGIIVMAAASH